MIYDVGGHIPFSLTSGRRPSQPGPGAPAPPTDGYRSGETIIDPVVLKVLRTLERPTGLLTGLGLSLMFNLEPPVMFALCVASWNVFAKMQDVLEPIEVAQNARQQAAREVEQLAVGLGKRGAVQEIGGFIVLPGVQIKRRQQ